MVRRAGGDPGFLGREVVLQKVSHLCSRGWVGELTWLDGYYCSARASCRGPCLEFRTGARALPGRLFEEAGGEGFSELVLRGDRAVDSRDEGLESELVLSQVDLVGAWQDPVGERGAA